MTTMREAMEAAYDEAEKVEAPESVETPEEVIDGDDGVEDEAETPEESEIEEVETEETTIEEPEEVIETTLDIPPPESWNGTVKEKWSELPAEVRAEIKRREDDFHKGMTKLDEDRNFGLRMKEVVSPYMPIIQAEGGTPEGAFKDYLNMAYTMRQGTPEQKANVIRTAMQQFGIDPRMVMSQPQANPEMMRLENELLGLKQQLTQKEQLQQQEEQSRINSEIEAFASDPANIYFNDVKSDMAILLESGKAGDMKEAYDMAIWANPQTRSRLLEAQQAEQKVKRQKEIEAKKKAASSLSTTSGQNGQSGKSNPKSLREELSAGLDTVYGSSRI